MKFYTLLIEGSIVLECCEERRREIEKTYRVVEMAYVESSEWSHMECGLGCINAGRTEI